MVTERKERKERMYLVGHAALGYLLGKAVSKLHGGGVNVPLLFTASILADMDLLIPGLKHRGPTHSIILLALLSAPLILLYGGKAAPYLVALIQHPLMGDCLAGGGVQLLWPISDARYGFSTAMGSPLDILLEWALFLASLLAMLKAGDMRLLFQRRVSNLILMAPLLAILMPLIFSSPIAIPWQLAVPHIAYLTVFTLSIFYNLWASI